MDKSISIPSRFETSLREPEENTKTAANLTTVIGDLSALVSRVFEVRQHLDKISDKLIGILPAEETNMIGANGGSVVTPSKSVLQQLNDLDKKLRIGISDIEKQLTHIEAVL